MTVKSSCDEQKNTPPQKAQGELLKPGAVTGQNKSRFVVLENGRLKYYTSPDLKEMKGEIDLRYYNVLPRNASDPFSVSSVSQSMYECQCMFQTSYHPYCSQMMKISLGPVDGIKRPNSFLGSAIAHQDTYEFLTLSATARSEWANVIQLHCDYYRGH